MPEELKPCPFCELLPDKHTSKNMYDLYDCPAGHTGQLSLKAWNTRRPAEKLVPLDKVKIYHLIKKYFLMIPGDDRPTNILQDTALDDACDEICASFGSVPVVPDEIRTILIDCDSMLSAYGHGRVITKEEALELSGKCRAAYQKRTI